MPLRSTGVEARKLTSASCTTRRVVSRCSARYGLEREREGISPWIETLSPFLLFISTQVRMTFDGRLKTPTDQPWPSRKTMGYRWDAKAAHSGRCSYADRTLEDSLFGRRWRRSHSAFQRKDDPIPFDQFQQRPGRTQDGRAGSLSCFRHDRQRKAGWLLPAGLNSKITMSGGLQPTQTWLSRQG